jgi:hypothetical protein
LPSKTPCPLIPAPTRRAGRRWPLV